MANAKQLIEDVFQDYGYESAKQRRDLSDFIALTLRSFVEFPGGLSDLDPVAKLMGYRSADMAISNVMPDYPEPVIDLMVMGLDDDELDRVASRFAARTGKEGQEFIRKHVNRLLDDPEPPAPDANHPAV